MRAATSFQERAINQKSPKQRGYSGKGACASNRPLSTRNGVHECILPAPMSSAERDIDKKPSALGSRFPSPSASAASSNGSSSIVAASTDNRTSSERGRSPVQIPFLFVVKLHDLLRDCDQDPDGKGKVVSWLPDGKSFKVFKPKEIITNILPTYFNQTKYKSFQRQLNLWGFERITVVGPEKGAYFHPHFQRDLPLVVEKLRRVRAIPKIPAKERRRREAAARAQQNESQSQPQAVKTKTKDRKMPPAQSPPRDTARQPPQPPPSVAAAPTEIQQEAPVDDRISTLLGVAETLSSLRKQQPTLPVASVPKNTHAAYLSRNGSSGK